MPNAIPTSSDERTLLTDRLYFLGQMGSTETALFHQKVAESFGIGITDMKTISTLVQEGPMTAGQIAERLSLTTGAVTNLVDRLEKRNIVQRTTDPRDRRKVIVKANHHALSKNSEAYQSIGRAYGQLLRNYSVGQLKLLVEYHEKQIEMTRQEIAKLATGSKKC